MTFSAEIKEHQAATKKWEEFIRKSVTHPVALDRYICPVVPVHRYQIRAILLWAQDPQLVSHSSTGSFPLNQIYQLLLIDKTQKFADPKFFLDIWSIKSIGRLQFSPFALHQGHNGRGCFGSCQVESSFGLREISVSRYMSFNQIFLRRFIFHEESHMNAANVFT